MKQPGDPIGPPGRGSSGEHIEPSKAVGGNPFDDSGVLVDSGASTPRANPQNKSFQGFTNTSGARMHSRISDLQLHLRL